jgi:hypothetical protein
MGGYAHLDEAALEPLQLTSGLSLLGEVQGDPAMARFAVRRGDGEVVRLSRLPYLVTVAIAEAAMASGALGRGVSADLVAAEVSSQSGQEVTAAGVRALVVGHLAPLGIVSAGPESPPPAGTEGPPPAGTENPAPAGPAGEQRRAGRRPRRRTVALGAVGLLAVAAGATVAVVAVTRSGSPARPAGPGAAANQARAVAWVAQQVGSGTMVSCDAMTCGQLRQTGFPAAQLMTLGPATQDPLGSAVVVATPGVRSEFGTQLASVYAPLMIADFGSGANRVEVRATAPDGPAVFATELKAQQASLRSAGQQLLRNRTIQASPAARADLLGGRVDARLLANLSVLSSQQTIKLVAFGDASPGASSAVPLRSVQLSATSAKDRAAILDFLRAQRGAYRPAFVGTTDDGQGQPVVTARFDAPAPLPAP